MASGRSSGEGVQMRLGRPSVKPGRLSGRKGDALQKRKIFSHILSAPEKWRGAHDHRRRSLCTRAQRASASPCPDGPAVAVEGTTCAAAAPRKASICEDRRRAVDPRLGARARLRRLRAAHARRQCAHRESARRRRRGDQDALTRPANRAAFGPFLVRGGEARASAAFFIADNCSN